MVRTKLDYSSANHPQTDGQTKVVNLTLGDLLCCLVGEHLKSWDLKLSQAKFAHNHVINHSIGRSLFEIVYERLP